jgi:transcriptional regulator with XRE-family HTH domain
VAVENARESLGLSQAEAAALLECGKRTLEHWEAGDRIPLAITQEGVLARLEKLRPPVRLWRGKAGRNRRADGP